MIQKRGIRNILDGIVLKERFVMSDVLLVYLLPFLFVIGAIFRLLITLDDD
jgi:hypothetical protein